MQTPVTKADLMRELNRPGGHRDQWFAAKALADAQLSRLAAAALSKGESTTAWVAASSTGHWASGHTRQAALHQLKPETGVVVYSADQVKPIPVLRGRSQDEVDLRLTAAEDRIAHLQERVTVLERKLAARD